MSRAVTSRRLRETVATRSDRAARRPGWTQPAAPVLHLLRVIPAQGRGLALGLAAATLTAGLAPALAVVASGWLAGAVELASAEGPGSAAGRRAVVFLVLLAASFVLTQAATRLSAALAATLGARLDAELQRRAIRAVTGPAGLAHLDDPQVSDLLSRVTGTGGYTPGRAVSGLATRGTQFVQGLAALVIVSFFHWWLAVPLFAAGLWWNRQNRLDYLNQVKAVAGRAKQLRRSEYLRDLVLRPAAAKEIRLFGLADWLTGRFRAEWDAAMGVMWRQRGDRTLPMHAALLALTGSTFAACALLGADAARHVVSISAAVIFLRAITIAGRSSTLGQQDMQIAYGLSALPAVTAVERAVADASGLEGAAPPVGDRGAQITFEGVAFRYPGTETPVLKRLDLSIPPSRSLAVVGANGAGKTTLVKLVCRFYDPDQGAVRVDGIDLRRLDARSWQRQVAAVFQDFQRFELSARDNIGFGATPLARDQEALERAAAAAGILDRIRSLPSGWDTPLARHLAGGADLSGGEWQRVALARALLAVEAGARLLILDEPTASLDVRAEAAFYDRFLELTRAVTTIVVSHRFSTVRRAELICVLDNGAVAELGSHEQLVAAGGRYARMYAAQSARFDEPGLNRPAQEERA